MASYARSASSRLEKAMWYVLYGRGTRGSEAGGLETGQQGISEDLFKVKLVMKGAVQTPRHNAERA